MQCVVAKLVEHHTSNAKAMGSVMVFKGKIAADTIHHGLLHDTLEFTDRTHGIGD